jgi:hypothetical protein
MRHIVCHPTWTFIAGYLTAFAFGVVFQDALADVKVLWQRRRP